MGSVMSEININYYWHHTETLKNEIRRSTYSSGELSLGAILVCEVTQSITSIRLANDGSVNGALGVVDQRPFARDTGGSLEEESHGELLELVHGVAEVGEFQLRLGGAVEETALVSHTTVGGELDVLVEEPQTL